MIAKLRAHLALSDRLRGKLSVSEIRYIDFIASAVSDTLRDRKGKLEGVGETEDLNAITLLVYRVCRSLTSVPPIRPEDRGTTEYDEGTFPNRVRGNDLRFWFAPGKYSRRRLFVLVHGWGSGKSSSSGHSTVEYLPYLRELGDVLLFDQSGHGESKGIYSFGISEHLDVLSALDYAERNLQYERIVLIGFCGGCAAVYRAAEMYSNRVSCVLDSPTDLKSIFTNSQLHERLFRLPVTYATLTSCIMSQIAGARVLEWDYKATYRPLTHQRRSLVFIGGNDSYIDYGARQEIRKIWSDDDIIPMVQSGHVRGFFQNPAEWRAAFEEYLGKF